MSTEEQLPEWVRGLVRRFRRSVVELAGTMPISTASVATRPVEEGPLEALATYRISDGIAQAASSLDVGIEAVRWLEANVRELVIEMRAEHRGIDFYHPFIERGLKRAIIVPVFQAGTLVGTVTVASTQRDAYTARDLRMARLLAGDLAPRFPRPARAAPTLKPDRLSEPETPAPMRTEPSTPEAGEALVETDPLGRISRWEGAAEGMFGLDRTDAVASTVAMFFREKHRHLLDPTLRDDLLSAGTFRGRALCYDTNGRAVTCEVELSRLETEGDLQGFRGRFRRVSPRTLLPGENVAFGFARLYTFSNRLK